MNFNIKLLIKFTKKIEEKLILAKEQQKKKKN